MDCSFIGEFEVSMDSKNRVIMPSKWRNKFSQELIICRGLDGTYEIWDRSGFFNMLSSFDLHNRFDQSVRIIKRNLLGSSREIAMDKWFRFVIPIPVSSELSIKDTLILRGNGDCVEIWTKDGYENWEKNNSFEIAASKYSDSMRISG